MYRIKVCGITTVNDALLAAEAGADAIGLNFYERSPRYVDAERAAAIIAELRELSPTQKVDVYGVFVNQGADDILWSIREGQLYEEGEVFGVQLHGDEPPELLVELRGHGIGSGGGLLDATGHAPAVPLVRALRCGDSLTSASEYLQACRRLEALPQAVLLDALQPGTYGGSGHKLDWQLIRGDRAQLLGLRVVLAGGLNPSNVAEAIEQARPDAVDVASGVESAPGRKDRSKVRDFVAAAKHALGIP